MEKLSSKYLHDTLYNATKYVQDIYLKKKHFEKKHYNVALSHVTKKLVRTIFAMEKLKQPYILTI